MRFPTRFKASFWLPSCTTNGTDTNDVSGRPEGPGDVMTNFPHQPKHEVRVEDEAELSAVWDAASNSGARPSLARYDFVAPQKNGAADRDAMPSALRGSDRDHLLLEHLPTVRYLARRIHERLPQHIELDDLISAGVVGLIDAFEKFDHNKKVQFKSYAQFRIRGAILDSLRMLDWSPRELRRKGRSVQDTIQTLTHKLQRAPTEEEIATGLDLDLKSFQQLLGDLKGLEIGSLHAERTEDSGEEELAYIAGSPEDSPLFRCLQGEMKQRMIDAVEELPEKERMVLTLYYYEELTMKEIGLTLGVVESRVSQIHSSAVVRLRATLDSMKATATPATDTTRAHAYAA